MHTPQELEQALIGVFGDTGAKIISSYCLISLAAGRLNTHPRDYMAVCGQLNSTLQSTTKLHKQLKGTQVLYSLDFQLQSCISNSEVCSPIYARESASIRN